MTLFNPIAGFFEWVIQMYNLMPFAIQALIALSLAIVIAMSVFGIFYKVKH